jgi:chromate transporter
VAVAVHAAWTLVPASWKRVGQGRAARALWVGYCLAGGAAAAWTGPWLVLVLVLVLLAAGLVEVAVRTAPATKPPRHLVAWPAAVLPAAGGGLVALA